MYLKTLKVLSKIILVLLFLWFLSPDIHFVVLDTLDLFSSKCVLQTNCKPVDISILNPPSGKSVSNVLNKVLVLTYSTNLPIDKIDLTKSKIEVWKSDFSLVPESQGKYNYTKVYEKNLTSSSFEITQVGNGTQILFTDEKSTSQYLERVYYLFLTDTSGKIHYNTSSGYYVPFFDLLLGRYTYLIQYLIWYLAIFGALLFRNPYSLIYDSKHKTPLSGVIVRIFKDGILYRTVVTSTTGIIDVNLDPGKYKLGVFKPGYAFPSNLSPLSEDGEYKNLYYGHELNITKITKKLLINIPIDPESAIENSIVKKVGLMVLYTVDSFNEYIILLLIISQIVVWPNAPETYIYLVIGSVLILFRLISKRITAIKLGYVVDENNERVKGLRLNLYDAQWNKLAATEVTDSLGTYQFSVPSGDYYIKVVSDKYILVDKKDLQLEKLNIAKVTSQRPVFINEDIRVKRLG